MRTHRFLEDTQGKGKGKGKSSREGQHVSEQKAVKRSKKPIVLFSAEEEQKLVDFLRDNKILCNKHLMDYKDRSKRKTVHRPRG